MTLYAFALNCSLESSGEPSSTGKLTGELLAVLGTHGVVSSGTARAAEHVVRPGVTSDEADGDEWPALRRRILDADISVLGTPIWMGHPSSIAQRMLERVDVFLGETDERGRKVSLDGVAVAAIDGNDNGTYHGE